MPVPSEKLFHPTNGTVIFASVPPLTKYDFPEGPVYLLRGRRSYGAAHIWERHRKEMQMKGFLLQGEVPAFVASIVKSWGPLHLEGRDRAEKLAVVQSKSGTAILQLFRPDHEPAYYSIVTAFLGFKRHGPRIGQLR